MNNTTKFRLVGTDEDCALYYCAFCGNIIPIEYNDNGDIDISIMDETCPECDAYITDVELD